MPMKLDFLVKFVCKKHRSTVILIGIKYRPTTHDVVG